MAPTNLFANAHQAASQFLLQNTASPLFPFPQMGGLTTTASHLVGQPATSLSSLQQSLQADSTNQIKLETTEEPSACGGEIGPTKDS